MIIFIPIKESSQRVPKKNFRKLRGIELYKICLYKLSDFKVYVDTDSDRIISEIKKDKRLSNISVYKRKKELTGHEVSVCSLIENLIKEKNIKNETICQVHVTSPFLEKETLVSACQKIKEGFDSVISCNEYQNRLWRRELYGYCPINHNPLKLEQTQDLPVYYEENSLFYMLRSDIFLKTKSRIGLNPYFYVCSFPENIDIDTEDDWALVKSLEPVEK
jgi:CMP-N-acetylneuraminic acid synthetase